VQVCGRRGEQLRPLRSSGGDFESSWNLCSTLRVTWCHILAALVLRVPYPQGIWLIIFIFVTVLRFTTLSYGMYYPSLTIYTNGQPGCRHSSNIIGGAPGDADWENLEMHMEAIEARISVSHLQRNSVWEGEAGSGCTDILGWWRQVGSSQDDGDYIFGRLRGR